MDKVQQIIIKKFEQGDYVRRRLLRDETLKSLTPPLLASLYTWTPVWPIREASDSDPTVEQWLRLRGATRNPFVLGVARSKTEALKSFLLQTWTMPQEWEAIENRQPCVIACDTHADGEATALMLCQRLQPERNPTAFVVRVNLPLENALLSAHETECLLAVTRAVGEAWLAFLVKHPSVIFDLSEQLQHRLAEWLAWVAGSPDGLRRALIQQGLSPTDLAGRLLVERIKEVLGTSPAVAEPSSSTARRWLETRPPDLEHTVLVAHYSPDRDEAAAQSHFELLQHLTNELLEAGVVVKAFVPDRWRKSPITLQWTELNLQKALAARLTLADGTAKFGEWFGPEPVLDADAKLARKAEGSLSRLLQLCARVIHEHTKNHPDWRDLDPQALSDVLFKDRTFA